VIHVVKARKLLIPLGRYYAVNGKDYKGVRG